MAANNKVIVSGRILEIGATTLVGNNKIPKRAVRVDISDSSYLNVVDVQLLHDNVEKGDKLSVGDQVEITCQLAGRLFDSKTEAGKKVNFIELQGYKIEVSGKKRVV